MNRGVRWSVIAQFDCKKGLVRLKSRNNIVLGKFFGIVEFFLLRAHLNLGSASIDPLSSFYELHSNGVS